MTEKTDNPKSSRSKYLWVVQADRRYPGKRGQGHHAAITREGLEIQPKPTKTK